MSDQEMIEPEIQLSNEEAVALAAKEQKLIATKRTVALMDQHGVSQTKLVGILADLAQFSAFANAASTVALGEHGNAAQKAFIGELNALPAAQAFLAAVQSGAIKIPALEKGVDAVMEELRLSVDAYLAAKAATGGSQPAQKG